MNVNLDYRFVNKSFYCLNCCRKEKRLVYHNETFIHSSICNSES